MSLKAEEITFSYEKGRSRKSKNKDQPLLDHINLEVRPGERIGILAPSGAGKTTFLEILSGYLRPDSGRVWVDGQPLPTRGYCPVQLVWQNPETGIDPRRKMRTVLEEGDDLEPRLINALKIDERWLERFPWELSGGELLRFCLARSLGKRTRYLLGDEISAMLDPVTQAQIWQFLVAECEKRSLGMAIVSHSPDLLNRVCTKVWKWNTF